MSKMWRIQESVGKMVPVPMMKKQAVPKWYRFHTYWYRYPMMKKQAVPKWYRYHTYWYWYPMRKNRQYTFGTGTTLTSTDTNQEKTGSATLVPIPHLLVPVPPCVNGLFEEPFFQNFESFHIPPNSYIRETLT